jgi:hypothetical protein
MDTSLPHFLQGLHLLPVVFDGKLNIIGCEHFGHVILTGELIIIYFIRTKINNFFYIKEIIFYLKKGAGDYPERSETGRVFEYPYILKKGVMFLNQEVVHLFPIGHVLKSGG